jgi:hypothetical protein
MVDVPPELPPTLENVHAVAMWTARAVHRLEIREELMDDRLSALSDMAKGLQSTSKDLGSYLLKVMQRPSSRPPIGRVPYVMTLALSAMLGGFLGEIVFKGCAYALGLH